MKGLTGERKRWPVLINRRRDTPKVSHSQTHKGVLQQSRTWNGIWEEWMETGEGRKEAETRVLIPFFFLSPFSLRPSLLLYFLHQLQACGPAVWVQSNCVHGIPLVSFVNTGAGSAYERMALIQNSSNGGLSSCSPIPALALSPLTVSSSFGGCINGGQSQEHWSPERVGGAVWLFCRVKRGEGWGWGGGVSARGNRRSVDPPATDYPPS